MRFVEELDDQMIVRKHLRPMVSRGVMRERVTVLLVMTLIMTGIGSLKRAPVAAQTVTLGESASSTTAEQVVNGIQLNASISATSLPLGENLTVSMTLLNTLSIVNNVSTAGNWTFQGVHVALWGGCVIDYPLEVLVVRGDYSVQNISQIANTTLPYTCYGADVVDHVIFQPNSDEANLTGTLIGSNFTSGPLSQSLSFSTAGYWDFETSPSPGQQISPPNVIAANNTVPATPFAPGTYTVAVEDEWGQALTLHFDVTSVATPSTTASSNSSTSSPGTTTSTSSASMSSISLSSLYALTIASVMTVLLVVSLAAGRIGHVTKRQ
jgi:hypothetical protein